MKKALLFLSLIFVFTLVKAQSNKEEIDLIQSVFGMEKKAIMAEFVKVDASQKDAFWKLYDEYETKRKELGKNRIALLEDYAKNYASLTNEKADEWTKQVISQSAKTDDLLVTYVKKISKATSPIAALQFYQVESYILSGIRVSILEELPLPDVK
jgi:F0F1-type ATP synthase delta subunit